MDGFAVYLNTDIMQFSKQPTTDYLRLFADGIATMDHIPKAYQYSELEMMLKFVSLTFKEIHNFIKFSKSRAKN